MFKQQTAAVKRLTLHQLRRSQAIPTLSVLVGKPIATRRLWLEWSQQAEHQTAVCVCGSLEELLQSWLRAAAEGVRSRILQKLASLTHQPADHLAGWLEHTSAYQTQQFWQRVHTLSEDGEILYVLLSALQPQESKTASLDQLELKDTAVLPRCFAVAVSLLPAAPGLFVSLPDTAVGPSLARLAALAEAVPALPLGTALTKLQARSLLDRSVESRSKAMVRSGLIEVRSPDSNSLKQWLSDRGLTDESRLQPMLHLVEEYGATSEVLETGLRLVDAPIQSDIDSPGDIFRSYQEWLLFQYLEARPTTVGRFQPNARIEIEFGNRPLEADFLDATAKIVIELDGYYHFGDAESYRRDRRKDVALQHHGFLVLRFLSEDIVSHIEDILATIDRALVLRQP